MGFRALVLWAILGALGAMAITAWVPVGHSLVDYNLAFLALALLAIPLWPFLQRRRVASLGMAYAGILATVTGFVMLFTRQLPLKEWMTWWHSVTSFAFMGLFLVHWWLNNTRLATFTRRLAQRARMSGPLAGAWGIGLGLGALTWSPPWRGLFTSENYFYLSWWVIWWGTLLAWGLWLAFRLPRLRSRLGDAGFRNGARAIVDTSLFLACWLALITGFALLYFADFLRGGDLKYVSKWWHTATSVAFLAFVALHIGFNARLVRAHARRIDQEIQP